MGIERLNAGCNGSVSDCGKVKINYDGQIVTLLFLEGTARLLKDEECPPLENLNGYYGNKSRL